MPSFKDLTGQRFGRLVVLGISHRDPKNKRIYWLCQCDCGNTTTVIGLSLPKGNTKSCGCFRLEGNNFKHGDARIKNAGNLYKIWCSMKRRCEDMDNKDYGGRGIRVCQEWQDDYVVFKDWALNSGGYQEGLSIERIDNNKQERGYSPENCRFATPTEQGRNKRNNLIYTYNGETHVLSEWAEILGMDYDTLRVRLVTYGWPVERAFTTPIRPTERLLEYNGEIRSVDEWGKALGISAKLIYSRLHLGWDTEKALTTPVNENISRKQKWEYEGETLTLKQLCEKFNQKYRLVQVRLFRGWGIMDALTTPVDENQSAGVKRKWEHNGELISLRELCRRYGQHHGLIYNRLRRGWGIERALTTPSRQAH